MSLLNNKDKGGNSSKFSYNHSVLKGLQSISDNTGDLAGILAPLLAAIAQETTLMSVDATLISVLNAIVASDQDIEILLVRDTGNNDEVVQQITNYETGIPVVEYKDVNGNAYVPVGPLEYLDPSAVLNLMLSELLDQGLTLDSIEVTTANTLIELLDQGLSLDGLNSLITTLNSTVATEITLAQVLVELQSINTDLDGLSLEATQQLVLTALNTVISNTTGLATEVTAALINSNVVLGNITLNSLLNAFNAEDFASETTLNNLLTNFNAEDFATELTLSGIKTKTDLLNFISTALEVTVTSSVLPTGAATETTLLATNSLLTIMDTVLDSILTDTNAMVVDLAAIEILITNTNSLLTTIDGVLDAIKLDTANLDVALSTRATEATQLLVDANLTLLNTKLNTLGQKASADSAPVVLSTEQEAILEAIKVAVQNLDMDVDGIATEATLAALLLAFNNEDFATQTTLASLLSAFNAEDFATQTTLASLLAAFNAEDFSTETTLASLLLAFNNEDFATNTTLTAVLAAIQALAFPAGLATEVTLASLLAAFNLEDFATETTLAAVAADLALIYTNLQLNTISVANIDTKLTPQARVHNTLSANAVGVIPAGSLCGSVINVGSAAGVWNGTAIPAGVSIPWTPIGNRDTYGAITYNGVGTTLIIEYTT